MRYFSFLIALTMLAGCSDAPETAAQYRIEDLRGQWVVINYWAKWCKPCIQEIPELNELNQRQQVSVLGVNFDGAAGEELASQVEALGVKFPTLEEDPAMAIGAPRPVVLPTTLILNRAGKVVQTLVGPQTLDSLERATEQAN